MANLNNIHVPLIRKKPKPDSPKTPDIKDENNCLSYNYTFKSRKTYMLHLIKVHHISHIRPLKELHKPRNVMPTINLLDRYCDVCNRAYNIRRICIRHLIQFHGMVLPESYSDSSNFDSKMR